MSGIDKEIIYKARNNSINLLLKASGTTQDLSGVTHMAVTFGSGVTISSSASPTLFSGVTSSTGQVILKFGSVASLTTGYYDSELIVYDASNTSGVMWGVIPITVKG